jgi:hypothetical protein
MESLLLFRRALSSPTMCRLIPALWVPKHHRNSLINKSENSPGFTKSCIIADNAVVLKVRI